MKLERFIFTFGQGQENAGHYQIIDAESWEKARELMFEHWGPRWAFQYSESDWNKEVMKMENDGFGFFVEKPLDKIIRQG